MKVGSTCYIQINPSYSVFTVAKFVMDHLIRNVRILRKAHTEFSVRLS